MSIPKSSDNIVKYLNQSLYSSLKQDDDNDKMSGASDSKYLSQKKILLKWNQTQPLISIF